MQKKSKNLLIIYMALFFGSLHIKKSSPIIIFSKKINNIKKIKKQYNYYLEIVNNILNNNINYKIENNHLIYTITVNKNQKTIDIGILYKELVLSIFQLAIIEYKQNIIIKENRKKEIINKNIDRMISNLKKIIKGAEYLSYFELIFDYIKKNIDEETKTPQDIISSIITPIAKLFSSEPLNVFFGIAHKYSNIIAADAHNRRIDFKEKYKINDPRVF